MKVLVDKIVRTPWDFKICVGCGTMNSAVNKECWGCNLRHTFRDLTVREAVELKKDYRDSEEEIEV